MSEDNILIMDDQPYTTTVGEPVGFCDPVPCGCHGRLVIAVDLCHGNGFAAVLVESDVYSQKTMDDLAKAIRTFLELDVLTAQFVSDGDADPFDLYSVQQPMVEQ